MHPELGNQEFRTTAALKARLEAAGLAPKVLPAGAGLICDIGTREPGRAVLAIRADLDALPIPDVKTVAYRSTVANRAHACGHDVHTTTVLGAGLVLAELDRRGLLPNAVRLIFQPAEEVLPGAARAPSRPGSWTAWAGSSPSTATPGSTPGRSGCGSAPSPPPATVWRSPSTAPAVTPPVRTSPPTSSPPPPGSPPTSRPSSPAGSTPARASRSPGAALEAGHAPNVIPQHAELSGTVRCLDLPAWRDAPDLVHAAIDEVATLHRAKSTVTYVRGVPRS
ncbi:amidohydrolase [Streptomyces tanashiensis]